MTPRRRRYRIPTRWYFSAPPAILRDKQIFPALQAMIRHGSLDLPIIGVARSGWNVDELRAHARDSLEQHGGVDADAFAKLSARLRYIDGDYGDAATYERLRQALGGAARPLHYLAIPPSMFATVVEGLAASGVRTTRASSSKSRSAAISPRRRTSIARCTRLPRIGHLSHRPLPGKEAGREPALFPVRQRISRTDLESQLRRERADHDGRELSACRAAARFYEEVGAIRDVVQNHMLQVMALLAMDAPAGSQFRRRPRRKAASLAGDAAARSRARSCAASSPATATSRV